MCNSLLLLRRKKFYKILISISILISSLSFAESKPEKKIVYLSSVSHPYTNFRLSYAFAHLAFDYYTAVEAINTTTGELSNSLLITLSGVVPLGITSIIFNILGFTKIHDYGYLEPTLSIREDRNVVRLDTGFSSSTYLGGTGRGGSYSAGVLGHYVNLSYMRKKILYEKPIGLLYHFHVDTKIQKLAYENLQEDKNLEVIASPLNFGASLRDDSLWKNAEFILSAGPDIMLLNFMSEKNYIVSTVPLFKGLGLNTYSELTIPIYKSIALAGAFRYSYLFKLYKSGETSTSTTYKDFAGNTTVNMLRYYAKLKLLGGYITPELFFSQEFWTGDKLTRVDDMIFGASISILF